MKTIKFMQWNCNVVLNKYHADSPAIQLTEVGTNEDIATASVWISGLEKGEIAIKDYSENEGMMDALIEAGIVTEPVMFIDSGWVKIPVCRLLKETSDEYSIFIYT